MGDGEEASGALVDLRDVPGRRADGPSASGSLGALLGGAASYAVLLLGPQGEIQTWNANAERMIGYRQADILGCPYATFFTAEDRACGRPAANLARAVAESRAQHDGVPTDGARIRFDGSLLWVEGLLTALRDRAGAVTGFISIARDVTDRYRAERANEKLIADLRRVNQQLEHRIRERTTLLERRTAELLSVSTELEAFSHSVSHDLRAPVRSVQGFARIVRDRYGATLPVDGRYYLDRIEAGAVRMGQLVDALLRLSRIQRQPMSVGRVDMTALVHRCWTHLMQRRPAHPVQLSVQPLEAADGDEELLFQVWTNLLDNAIKYSSHRVGARVEVSSTVHDDVVVYQLRDNGVGFDSRYSDKIFQSFQRLHPGEEDTGIGVGLAIVHRVLLRHGGRIWADGEIGVGSTFSFELRKVSHAAE
jgi:PAS domain S-box-containing protein